ncbi:MAG: hypothetical protein ACHQE5_08060, partial [Actinomycetes bacterium]
MDAARRLSVTAGVTAVAVAVYNPVATVLLQHADPTTHPLPPAWFAALTLVTVLGGVWYLVRDAVQPRVRLLAAHPVAVDLATLLGFQLLITVQVATTGGIRHSMWLYFVFVIVFASAYLPLQFTPAFGLLSSGCMLLASWLAGSVGSATAGDLIVAGLGLPLLSAFATVVASAVRSLRRDSERARAELGQQV